MISDREIMRRCQCGQTELLDVLIDRYSDHLYSLCARLAGSRHDADDLFQDTWVNVMKSLGSFSLEKSFSSWLNVICVNRYRDRYRSKKRWYYRLKRFAPSSGGPGAAAGRTGHLPGGADGNAGVRPEYSPAGTSLQGRGTDEQVIRNESVEAVGRALEGLKDIYRLPVILHYIQELSIDETAGLLGIPPGTVKSRLSRGRSLLRESMEEEGYER